MNGKELDVLIERIGRVLANMISDSGDVQDLLDQLRDLGYEPHLTLDARLMLYNDEEDIDGMDDDVETKEVKMLEPEERFESMLDGKDERFLRSIHIKLTDGS